MARSLRHIATVHRFRALTSLRICSRSAKSCLSISPGCLRRPLFSSKSRQKQRVFSKPLPFTCGASTSTAHGEEPSSPVQPAGKDAEVRRFAILGAGFAGVALAYHLLQYAKPGRPIAVEVFDESGIGAGASGVSGGLLHPYSPKGKLLWRGAECWKAAQELLAAAEAAYKPRCSAAQSAERRTPSDTMGQLPDEEEPIAWRRGILRPASTIKQAQDFQKIERQASYAQEGATCISGTAAQELVPGLAEPVGNVALHMPLGTTVHPSRYLKALWRACNLQAESAIKKGAIGTAASLNVQRVASLSSIRNRGFDAVVVCLGAAALLLPEIKGRLPLTPCRGKVLEVQVSSENEQGYGKNSPSLLGNTWIAVQGSKKALIGATKEYENYDLNRVVSGHEAVSAAKELLPKATQLYPPIEGWPVTAVRAGVRALPPRTSLGSLPIVGRLDDLIELSCTRGDADITENDENKSSESVGEPPPSWWIIGGLGSRGLVYHAWLGQQMAAAILAEDEELLPLELRQWKLTSKRPIVSY